MDQDFNNQELDPALREIRSNIIDRHTELIRQLVTESEKTTSSYLFLINSGGAVAVLGFMGAIGIDIINNHASKALIAFATGILIHGIYRMGCSLWTTKYFRTWNKLTFDYYIGKIGWSSLTQEKRRRLIQQS